jgi:hypothetical protein
VNDENDLGRRVVQPVRCQQHRIAGNPVCGIARRFQIATESIAHLILSFFGFLGSRGCSGDSAWTDDARQCFLDCIIDAQSSEGDAERPPLSIQARLQL